MARPKKDNAEYFPHDAGMRNDDRIKALRKKHGLKGYAIWNMLIEYLTGRDFFQFEYNEFTLEIMSGDFDADVSDIQSVISYCLILGLLQQNDGLIRCKTLENRLDPLLQKRERDRTRVIAVENPQSKVKESKGKKSKEEESKGYDAIVVENIDIEEKLLALGEIYIDQQRIKWPHINFDFELNSFREKVRGSPDHYAKHDAGGIRLAFQAQLRNAKSKNNGISKKSAEIIDRREAFARRHGTGSNGT